MTDEQIAQMKGISTRISHVFSTRVQSRKPFIPALDQV